MISALVLQTFLWLCVKDFECKVNGTGLSLAVHDQFNCSFCVNMFVSICKVQATRSTLSVLPSHTVMKMNWETTVTTKITQKHN